MYLCVGESERSEFGGGANTRVTQHRWGYKQQKAMHGRQTATSCASNTCALFNKHTTPPPAARAEGARVGHACAKP